MKTKVEKDFNITKEIVIAFSEISQDFNPIHLDENYASNTKFGKTIAHGMLCSSFFSGLIATELPGPGSIYLGQNLKFLFPVYIGDRLKVVIEVIDVRKDKPIFTLSTKGYVNEKIVIDGQAIVLKEN
jgi:acyl dehydratase